MKNDNNTLNKNIKLILLCSLLLLSFIALYSINVTNNASANAMVQEESNNYTYTDDYGYSTVAIGTSEIYAIQDFTPICGDTSGYVTTDGNEKTGLEFAIIVDSGTNTEYIVFRDSETGNITSVERRKYEETK